MELKQGYININYKSIEGNNITDSYNIVIYHSNININGTKYIGYTVKEAVNQFIEKEYNHLKSVKFGVRWL